MEEEFSSMSHRTKVPEDSGLGFPVFAGRPVRLLSFRFRQVLLSALIFLAAAHFFKSAPAAGNWLGVTPHYPKTARSSGVPGGLPE